MNEVQDTIEARDLLLIILALRGRHCMVRRSCVTQRNPQPSETKRQAKRLEPRQLLLANRRSLQTKALHGSRTLRPQQRFAATEQTSLRRGPLSRHQGPAQSSSVHAKPLQRLSCPRLHKTGCAATSPRCTHLLCAAAVNLHSESCV